MPIQRKFSRAKAKAQLIPPDELLDSPLPQDTSEPPKLQANGEDPQTAGLSAPEEQQPTPPPQPQLPLAIALPQQTRRVREQVLPAWYHHRYAGPGQDDPAVADHIVTMNAALTTAEQAMMTQDVGLMLFAYRALERFNV